MLIIFINITRTLMFGLSGCQSISAITILTSIVFYFAANDGLKQNAFIYVFAIALTMLIVGRL